MTDLHVDSNPTSPETPELNCDIVIVGGGIVGATLAAALKDSGLSIIIIEANSLKGAAARERAYALSPLSGEIFKSVGIWDDIFPHIGKYRHIHLSDADDPGIVKFKTADLNTDYLGYVGEHKNLLQSLQQVINRSNTINWLCPAKTCGVRYEADYAVVNVDVDGQQQQVRTQLVVAADGARSQIRQWANIQTFGWKYWQSCVTFMIKHEAPQNDIAFERFWPNGPMGVLPLPGNRCHIVWTAPHGKAKAIQELSEAEFLEQLEYCTGGLLGKLELITDRLLFPVQLYQSQRYVQSRLALVGDAAHRCHPLGGQGLNLGIRDAAALAQVLLEAQQQGENLGDVKVLKRYQRWRQTENLAILGFTDLLDRVFSNHWLPMIWMRRLGLFGLRTLPPFKVFALKLMTGFQGRTPTLRQPQKQPQTSLS